MVTLPNGYVNIIKYIFSFFLWFSDQKCTLSLNRSDLYVVEKECAYCGVGTEVMTVIFINSAALISALYFSPF